MHLKNFFILFLFCFQFCYKGVLCAQLFLQCSYTTHRSRCMGYGVWAKVFKKKLWKVPFCREAHKLTKEKCVRKSRAKTYKRVWKTENGKGEGRKRNIYIPIHKTYKIHWVYVIVYTWTLTATLLSQYFSISGFQYFIHLQTTHGMRKNARNFTVECLAFSRMYQKSKF